MAEPGDAADQGRSGEPRRFVLLCRPNDHGHAHVPDALRAAIASRRAEMTVRTGPYQAMADLIEHEQAFRVQGPTEALVLIVIEPDEFPQSPQLVDAATRYAPHAVCWRYSARAAPKLAAFIEAASSDATPPASPVEVRPGTPDTIRPRPPQTQKPRLRLAGDPPGVSHNEGEDAASDNPGGKERPVLSEEELEMLLSDDWERQTREGGPS